MNVILLRRQEVNARGVATLADDRAAHVRDVLRAVPGQHVRVGLLDGSFGDAVVTAVDANGVAMTCAWETDVPPRPRVDVLLALPRPKVMKRLWSQLAALGVGQIILTNAARVERPYFDTHVLDPATYEPLLVEGLQQARDTMVPHVSVHRRFRPLVEDTLNGLFPDGTRLMADPQATTAIGAALADTGDRLLLAIGPEGGWVDFERSLLAAHGFRAVSMGARTLRTDTAAVALLALVHDALARPTRGRLAAKSPPHRVC